MSQSTNTESSKSILKRPPPPLPPPLSVQSNGLTAALYQLFSKSGDANFVLSDVLAADVTWKMPLFNATSRKQVCDALDQFLSFSLQCTIAIFDVVNDEEDGNIEIGENGRGFSFEWTLSFLYPLPWRPRVAFSGATQATTNSEGLVTALVDDWYAPPVNIIQQTLPRLKDFFWLWPSPHAEMDSGTRRVLKTTPNYKIIAQAPRAEVHIVAPVKENERELIYVTPALPADVFEGGLRRLEFYSTVSPLSIRQLHGDDFEWVVAVPGAHVGSSNILFPTPMVEGVTVRVTGKRIFATYRFRGFSTRSETEKRLQKLVKHLRDDSVWEGDILASDVWVRSYDIKVGFNSAGLISMAMYTNSRGVPRVNEIAIDITDRWER